jgi:hypothetical protein
VRIKTKYWAKPISRRDHDWEAWDDDLDGAGPVGFGADEQAAINDLKEKLSLE